MTPTGRDGRPDPDRPCRPWLHVLVYPGGGGRAASSSSRPPEVHPQEGRKAAEEEGGDAPAAGRPSIKTSCCPILFLSVPPHLLASPSIPSSISTSPAYQSGVNKNCCNPSPSYIPG
ncbi:hypothetical protein PVAP13_9KG021400 [Panicum virgatum]|uniref:Uncharacterized protein n=1 Tax=Panicum virgatum TaxID=38727 RepID=A0A8T0N672_PANVG|nr:hypothetical protein PVAP13_9KG021400 [Panicum virgatum]